MNLQEDQEINFDFLAHFKQLGNQILSLFKQKDADPSDQDDDGEGNI